MDYANKLTDLSDSSYSVHIQVLNCFGEFVMSIGLYRGTVVLEKHQKMWKENAKKTISVLRDIFSDTAVDIQHVGSSAIESICAKPIIDIVVGVNNINKVLELNKMLEEKGFIFRGQDHPDQYLYVCGTDDFITHHIHVCIYDSDTWNDYINMRDYLKHHKDDARSYEDLKKKLALRYPNDRKTYTLMKSNMIQEILDKAKRWRKE